MIEKGQVWVWINDDKTPRVINFDLGYPATYIGTSLELPLGHWEIRGTGAKLDEDSDPRR